MCTYNVEAILLCEMKPKPAHSTLELCVHIREVMISYRAFAVHECGDVLAKFMVGFLLFLGRLLFLPCKARLLLCC
jgi:hypothetical protein